VTKNEEDKVKITVHCFNEELFKSLQSYCKNKNGQVFKRCVQMITVPSTITKLL